MAFAVYTYVTQSAPILTGDVFTIPYDVGDGQYSFAGSGEHLATGPFEQLFTEPEAFDATFQAGQIQIEWKTTPVPIGNLVRFQFARTANPMIDGMPVALADLSNADVTDFAMGLLQAGTPADLVAIGLAPSVSPVFTGNPTAPTPALGDDDTSIATTGFVQDALDAQLPAINAALALKANAANALLTGMASIEGLAGKVVTPAALPDGANANDYNPPGLDTATILRVWATTPGRIVTGLQGQVAGKGRLLLIQNASVHDIAFAHNSPQSAAANRFALGTDRDSVQAYRILQPFRSLLLFYDPQAQRWTELTAFDPRVSVSSLPFGQGTVTMDPQDGGSVIAIATKDFAVAMAAAL